MSMTGSWSERISVSTMSALERAEMTLEAMMIERVGDVGGIVCRMSGLALLQLPFMRYSRPNVMYANLAGVQ